ncbi:MAG: substrate-binding domain-containing protein, partial [Burkholderiaceae bacterium]
MTIHLLSGGAAQGLVGRLQAAFAQDTGHEVQGRFGAVGLQRDTLLSGAPCDVLILTRALIEQLQADGHVVAGSAQDLGSVATGVAVKSGAPRGAGDTPDARKAALMAARGIYIPAP